ncbi:hypothetical protein JQX13_14430 [Archangium violaceum]|uniref:hypothetical protein n=1 Tax=Archangium violaceum TaxID=83451 RepID=UPI00193AF93E|nr:hypothetical protein [Archangium violaceum]QRK11158.1 hypothetical protein JQX13_14430 [Archangium violaceum]
MKPRGTGSVETWARDFAEEEGWKTEPELVKNYWHEQRRLRDRQLGLFILGRFQQLGVPLGGEHVWMLLFRAPSGRWNQSLGPLETQPSYSNTTEVKVRAVDMKLLGKRGEARRLLWIELEKEIAEYLEKVDDFRREITRYGHVFQVGKDGSIQCVATDIPLSLTVTVQGREESSSSLKVTFPRPAVMKVEASSPSLPPEQEKWVGEYDVSGRSPEPSKETGHGG